METGVNQGTHRMHSNQKGLQSLHYYCQLMQELNSDPVLLVFFFFFFKKIHVSGNFPINLNIRNYFNF